MVIGRRRGAFSIPTQMIAGEPEVVKKIMGRCLIIRAEVMGIKDVIEYQAVCDDFDEVKEGELMPEYRWLVDSETGDVRCERCDK